MWRTPKLNDSEIVFFYCLTFEAPYMVYFGVFSVFACCSFATQLSNRFFHS